MLERKWTKRDALGVEADSMFRHWGPTICWAFLGQLQDCGRALPGYDFPAPRERAQEEVEPIYLGLRSLL